MFSLAFAVKLENKSFMLSIKLAVPARRNPVGQPFLV